MLRKLIDSPWLYFALAGVLLVLMVVSQFEPVSKDRPEGSVEDLASLSQRDDLSVLFILIDTLRADRLEPWGYHRKTSPNIQALAEGGIRFSRAESQSSWTKASMASLWTGMYPERTGVQRFLHGLPDEATMPAEHFKEAGYRTAGIWRNGWVANNFGFDQGFDLYLRPVKDKGRAKGIHRNSPSAHRLQGTDLDATLSAMEFLLGVGEGERFFLYVHYMDVHQYLYADSSPDWGSDFEAIYDASIHWTDRNVGLLMEMLKTQGLLDKTLVVIAADHGDAFFEHGKEGHARDLYVEVQHVPLLIIPPFEIPGGIVVDERVANVDIWPTVLDLVGLPPLPYAEGRSLVPLIHEAAGGEPAPADLKNRALFAQLDLHWGQTQQEDDPLLAMTKDDHRLVWYRPDPAKNELYDDSADPKEQNNIIAERADLVQEYGELIEEFLARPRVQYDAPQEVKIDEMHKAQLRALGYVVPASDRRAAEREAAEKAKQAAADAARGGTDGDAADEAGQDQPE